MKILVYIIMALACILGLAVAVMGIVVIVLKCTRKRSNNNVVVNDEPPICGGVKDRSFDAPKIITSKEIKYFHSSFFRPNYDEGNGQFYDYEINIGETGTFVLTDKCSDGQTCEISSEQLLELDNIIKGQNIAAENGTDRVTAGLPPEYSPTLIEVEYASGERIFVQENGDPDSVFTAEIVKYFNSILKKHQ